MIDYLKNDITAGSPVMGFSPVVSSSLAGSSSVVANDEDRLSFRGDREIVILTLCESNWFKPLPIPIS